VVLCFGTVREYKGVDVLLEAFRELEGAELWIVGRPLGFDMEPLRELAAKAPGRVRFVTRYLADSEAQGHRHCCDD
jgi:glycosyltransferase involved in cell wall biosynthesis